MKNKTSQILLNIILFLMSLCFLMPLMIIISSSLMGEGALQEYGYSFWPKRISFEAYQFIFKNPNQIINSYCTTIFVSVTTMGLGTFIMCLTAYPLSKKSYRPRNAVTFLIFFTMLFGGGLIPSYIINTQYLHLGNTYWIYILPSLCSAWNIIIIRTFFMGIPDALKEAAKIEGASEWRIFFQIIIPLSKAVIATIALMTLLAKWNDWNTALIYIRDSSKYSLQYLLQRMLRESELIKEMNQNAAGMIDTSQFDSVATETIRFAMVIIAAGPMLVVFPFFQKYFAKGLTIGAVKG